MKIRFYALCFIVLLLLLLSACTFNDKVVNNTPDTQQYTIDESFNMYIKANKISGEVLYFTSDYFNGTDKMQAFAIVGNQDTGDLWFADNDSYKKLLNGINITKAPTVIQTSSKPIYLLNGIGQSFAYIVTDTGAVLLEGVGENLTPMGKDDFFTLITDTDAQQKSIISISMAPR